MYTQCPECESAFRVTAEVLKQAGGMVRCGSCGNAFNSLEYLSEQKPARREPEPSLPELKPEPPESSSTNAMTDVPKTISAEQSAALLKTLDQLAGEDIRIEDTGVEWRVLGADDEEHDENESAFDPSETDVSHLDAETEIDFSDADDIDEKLVESENTGIWIVGDSTNLEDAAAAVSSDPTATIVDEPDLFESGSTQIDELLDETPTPVDEVLEAGGDNIENAELFQTQMMDSRPIEESADLFRTQEISAAPAPDHAELFERDDHNDASPAPPAEDEMRFDDNTPLPDDFLDDDEPARQADSGIVEPAASLSPPPPVDAQDQFSLSEPDEWEQLLDEFDDLLDSGLDVSPDGDVSAASEARVEDEESIEADLMSAAFENDQPATETMKGADASIEEDLMSAAFDVEADGDNDTAVSDLAEANAELGDVLDEASRLAESLDDESGRFQLDDEDIERDDERRQRSVGDESIAEELKALEEETESPVGDERADDDSQDDAEVAQSAAPDDEEVELDAAEADDEELELDAAEADDEELDVAEADDERDEAAVEAIADDETADAANDEVVEIDERERDEHEDELDLADALEPDDDGLVDEGESEPERSDDDLPELHDVGDRPKSHHDVPPMTEEEETINMLIDQDLLAIAQVDDDGFASTIVVEKEAAPVNVETVIIGDADDEQQGTGEEVADAVPTDHERSGIFGLTKAKAEDDAPAQGRGRTGAIAAAVVLLAVALAGQLVHQNRASLATNPTFANVLNPVYDSLGRPITPDWDVSGWDIARTQGATDEQDQLLTIFSEIRNTSDAALPYPIVTLSLTNRYQDSIGALVLEPADYLADRSNAAGMVPAGGKFEAVIPIDEPSPDAIGYTINACYRTPGSDLRCAVPDFK